MRYSLRGYVGCGIALFAIGSPRSTPSTFTPVQNTRLWLGHDYAGFGPGEGRICGNLYEVKTKMVDIHLICNVNIGIYEHLVRST